MKLKILLQIVFVLALLNNLFAQHNNFIFSNNLENLGKKEILIGMACGIKYYSKISNEEKDLEKSKTSPCLSLIVGLHPFNKQEHTIGLELLAYKYGKSKDGNIANVVGVDAYYRYSFYLSSEIFIFPQSSLCLISNEPGLMLSLSFELGVAYTQKKYEISLKNSFRSNIFTWQNVPTLLLLSFSIKI